MISAIVAVDQNWGIGYKGELLEHLPPDLKYFKELTTGHVVVMGRKTWDSLPKKPLPNRINYVITREAKSSNEEVAYFDMNCIKMMIQK
jgi:dihydrofolate reductase